MNGTSHKRNARQLAVVTAVMLCLALFGRAETKEFKYTANAGTTVSINNVRGAISVKPAAGRQVIIHGNAASNKVEVDATQSGNRIAVRSHLTGKPSGDEARVDYDIQVPADVGVSIESGSGDIRVEGLRGGVAVDAEDGAIEVRGVSGGFVQIQSVNGGVTLNNVQKGRVQAISAGGNIRLENVSGSSVTAKSTSGKIVFLGDFNGGGNYLLTNHSGDIEITMPATASVDLVARSMNGSVENDFPLQKPAHAAVEAREGKSLVGTANSAASSVELRSFSGKIRVKKQ